MGISEKKKLQTVEEESLDFGVIFLVESPNPFLVCFC